MYIYCIYMASICVHINAYICFRIKTKCMVILKISKINIIIHLCVEKSIFHYLYRKVYRDKQKLFEINLAITVVCSITETIQN